MPFSHSRQISSIVGYAEELQPQSVLDVGVGMGQYGFLLRTNLENINLFDINGAGATQRHRRGWSRVIDGVEGFAAYLTPVHDYAYNRVLIGDAIAVVSEMPDASYELVLAVDILEHFTKDDGYRFLRECTRVCSKSVLVSTPKNFVAQDVAANPLENHRSHWTQAELVSAGFNMVRHDLESWIAIHERA